MNWDERLLLVEVECRALQKTICRLKRLCACLLAVLVCVGGVAAGNATPDAHFETLTARQIHVATPDSPFGILIDASRAGAGIILTKDGNQAPEQMVSIAIGGKDEAAIGMHSQSFNMLLGGGSQIQIQDLIDPNNVRAKRIAID